MPRKNGVDLLNDIAHLDCNVIILSSYDNFEYMKAGIQHHVLDYLLKPVRPCTIRSYFQKLSVPYSSNNHRTAVA